MEATEREEEKETSNGDHHRRPLSVLPPSFQLAHAVSIPPAARKPFAPLPSLPLLLCGRR